MEVECVELAVAAVVAAFHPRPGILLLIDGSGGISGRIWSVRWPVPSSLGVVPAAAASRAREVERLRRVRDAWVEVLCCYGWRYFCTLTLRSELGRTGHEGFVKAFRWWLYEWQLQCAAAMGMARRGEDGRPRGAWVNAHRKGRGRPVWVLALELQRNGHLHGHALIQPSRVLVRWDYSVGHRLWNEGHGFAWIERPVAVEGVAGYVSKYVVKEQDGRCRESDMLLSPNLSMPGLLGSRYQRYRGHAEPGQRGEAEVAACG